MEANKLGNSKFQNKTAGIIAGLVIFVIVGGFVCFTIMGSFAKPTYSVSKNSLTISGQYGVKIDLSGAAAAHILSQVPATETKTNGASIGNIEKGYFKISGTEVYCNVMDKNQSDYILITGKDGSKYYINCSTSVETNNLYNQISSKSGSEK